MSDPSDAGEMTGASIPRPYGPETAAIRRFLVRFAGLGQEDRRAIVDRFLLEAESSRFQRAEQQLAIVMERSGREAARDALSGPLLQLVRVAVPPAEGAGDGSEGAAQDPVETLDPVAEPALAALLALLVRDLIDPSTFAVLYSAMEPAIAADAP